MLEFIFSWIIFIWVILVIRAFIKDSGKKANLWDDWKE